MQIDTARAPEINVAFEKDNKRSPLKCANLFLKSAIRPKPLEKIPKINKRRGMFIPDSYLEYVLCDNEKGFQTRSIK